MKWLDAHIPYPTDCIKSGIEGSLEITFLVAPDGSIREPAVSKKLHPKLDALALSAIRRMPKWHPENERQARTRQSYCAGNLCREITSPFILLNIP